MNPVVARVKDRGNNKIRKLMSDQRIFDIPKFSESLEYSPETLLEQGQWYIITEFSKTGYNNPLLTDEWNSTLYSEDKVDVGRIVYICAYQDEDYFCFQKVMKSKLLKNKMLAFGDSVKVEEPNNRLIINEEPDAIYRRSTDTLYFKNLMTIECMFKDITSMYRAATDVEVKEFLKEEFVKTNNGFDSDKVGMLNRHRLAIATASLSKMSKKQKNDVFTYTSEYYPSLKYDGKSFEIGSDDDLKILLYGIGQRYYTTPVTKERRIANSITPIK